MFKNDLNSTNDVYKIYFKIFNVNNNYYYYINTKK